MDQYRINLFHRYKHLQQLAKERKQRLDESKKRHELSREINELESWINDKVPTCLLSIVVSKVTF